MCRSSEGFREETARWMRGRQLCFRAPAVARGSRRLALFALSWRRAARAVRGRDHAAGEPHSTVAQAYGYDQAGRPLGRRSARRACAPLPKKTPALSCDTTPLGEYQLTDLGAGKVTYFHRRVCSPRRMLQGIQYPVLRNAQSSAGSPRRSFPGSKNIDATLAPGGAIAGHGRGRVAPLAFARVCVFPASVMEIGELFQQLIAGNAFCTATNASGDYKIGGLSTGSYKVGFTGEVCTNQACTEVSEAETGDPILRK